MPITILSAPTPQPSAAAPLSLAAALLLLAGCAAKDTVGEDATVAGTVHVCTSCHGMEGRSLSPTFPNLAGQQREYIVAQLKAFRDKTRADPHAHTYMWGMAARLDDATIEGLAAYFSQQEPAQGTQGDPTLVAAGARIYRDGIEAENVPACMACHGEKAEGSDAVPRLADQHDRYLREQLAAFQSSSRANETMHENSKGLSPAEIEQLSAYLAAM